MMYSYIRLINAFQVTPPASQASTTTVEHARMLSLDYGVRYPRLGHDESASVKITCLYNIVNQLTNVDVDYERTVLRAYIYRKLPHGKIEIHVFRTIILGT